MWKRLWQQLGIGTNWPILAAISVLATLGTLSIWAYAATQPETHADHHAGQKQLVYLGIGVGCMFLFQAINYQKLGRLAWAFYFFSLLLVLYTVIGAARGGERPLPLVSRVNFAYAWINFGPISLQPAELTKLAFVMVLARYLRFRENYRTMPGLLAPFGLALVPIALILKQPDLGTALTFIPALFVMLFVAGARRAHLFGIVGLGIAMVPVLWLSGQKTVPLIGQLPEFVKPYQRERVYSMFNNDERTARKTGFQQKIALTAIGSGGVTGKGLGALPVGAHVPEGHNDMIFSLVAEQFGFFGAAAILGAYAVLFAAGIEIAGSTREPFGRLVAPGIVALLAGQAFMNMMVVLKLMPVTGVTLPFVSYGGSSLVASFMAAGLLLNIGQNRPMVMAKTPFEY